MTDDESLLREMWCAYTLHATPKPFDVKESMRAVLAVVREHDAATVDALRALAELGRWCLTESRENDCSDVGGGSLQDKAIELGLLAYVTVAEPCGEACACMDYYAGDEWPHDCLRETERAVLKGEP